MALVNVAFLDFKQNYEKYTRQAREAESIIHLETPGSDLGIYVVSSHAGVNEVLKNESGAFVHFADFFAAQPNKSAMDKKIGDIFALNLGNNSGMHIELRKDIRNHFNGSGVDQHVDFMRMCSRDLLKRLKVVADQNDGVVDMVKDFSLPLMFLITSHVIGLEFDDDDDRAHRTVQAAEAINLINLLACDADKAKALSAHDKLSAFILPQLEKYRDTPDGELRKDCLFYDFAEKMRHGEAEKLDSFIELVNGLFQAGLGATGNFFNLCLHLLLTGDEFNTASDLKGYYFASERTDEEKREAISEYIRIVQHRLGGLLPRYTSQGGAILGATVQPNSLIYLSFVSANFDERAFSEPRLAKPGRAIFSKELSQEEIGERRHMRSEKSVSFSYGEHMCPGRRIALTIIRYALDELFAAYPNMTSKEINIISEIFGKPSELTSFYVNLYGDINPSVD